MSLTLPVNQAVPVIVSVVGHRHLRSEDETLLTEKVTMILKGIRSFVPMMEIESVANGARPVSPNWEKRKKTGEVTPFILLSPLAEGADRLVAKIARGLGYRIGAVLPMPADSFRKDFPDSRKEFDDLLAQADFIHVVTPGPPLDENARQRCYDRAGIYLCRQSQYMVALWDGDEKSGNRFGTAAIVRRQREGETYLEGDDTDRPRWIDRNAPGPVYHVMAPRRGVTSPPVEAGTVRLLLPKDIEKTPKAWKLEAERWDKVSIEIDRFNKAADRYLKRADARIRLQESGCYLRCDTDFSSCTEVCRRDKIDFPTKKVVSVYALADMISQRRQSRRKLLLTLILVIVSGAWVVNDLYSSALWKPPWDLAIGIAMFGMAFVLYKWIELSGLERGYIEYRGLAEALRVQYNWNLVGMKDRVSDHYLRSQRDALEWIRQAAINVLLPESKPTVDVSAKITEEVPAARDSEDASVAEIVWLDGQAGYFKRAIKNCDDQSMKWNWRIKACAVTGAVLAGTTFSLHALFATNRLPGSFWPAIFSWMGVVYQTFFAAAVSFKVYLETMAFEEDAERYHISNIIFSQAKTRIHRADPLSVYFQLGQEALQENAEWVNRHSDRKIPPPL